MRATVPDDPLLVWGLATFHTTCFALVAVLLAYRQGMLGSILGGLNTLVGFGSFLLLWLTTWWITRFWVRSLSGLEQERPIRFDDLLGHGIVWGGATGVLFFLGLAMAGFVYIAAADLLAGQPQKLGPMLFLGVVDGTFGAGAAALAGAMTGLAFATVDSMVILSLRRLLPPATLGPGATREP